MLFENKYLIMWKKKKWYEKKSKRVYVFKILSNSLIIDLTGVLIRNYNSFN